jgi:CheY-like chemotaxis protein
LRAQLARIILCVSKQLKGNPVSAPVPRSILVVEDEALVRIMVADDLMAAGFNVTQTCSGDEALKFLETVRVDLLITDLNMPDGIDGAELARRVRARWPNVKIMALTTYGSVSVADAPIDGRIDKPYKSYELINYVHDLLAMQ